MAKKKLKHDDLKKVHRFQSFSDRIANIRINVAHRVEHVAESAEEKSTFFGEGLAKWRELNCTTDFVSFLRETHHMAGTLPQLVHHKDEIVSKLKHYLQIKHTLAHEPLLDLLVQLARDLQTEFYPYFKDFFPILVSMTDTLDSDVIQCVFTCLAYLFKFLWRYMIKDIENVFTTHSELLGASVKPHIRQFAVESFGFLLRKVRDHSALFDIIFRQLSDTPDLAEGVGQLLFEMCRGVPQQFHSCTDSVLPLLLGKLGHPQFSSDAVFQALSKMMKLMAEHTRKEFAGSLWKPLLSHSLEVHSSVGCGGDAEQELSHVLHLIGILTSWRRGSRITDLNQVVEVIVGVLSERLNNRQTLSVAVHLAASLVLISPHLPHTRTALSSLVRGVWCVRVVERHEVEVVIEFFQELAEKYLEFEEDILCECLAFCCSAIESGEHYDLILKFLAELCLQFEPPMYTLEDGHKSPTNFVLDFDRSSLSHTRLRKKDVETKKDKEVIVFLTKMVSSWRDCFEAESEKMEVDEAGVEQLWASVLVLRHTRPCCEEVVRHLVDLYSHLREMVLESEDASESHLLLLSQCLSSLVRVVDHHKLKERLPLSGLLELLKKMPSFLPLLSSVEEYLTSLSSGEAPESLSANWLLEFLPVLQCNLSSPQSTIRLATLRILCTFEQLPLIVSSTENAQSEDRPVTDILELCLKAEEIDTDLNTYRRKILWLQKLSYSPSLSPRLPDIYKEVRLRFLIGTLYVNFSLIWEPVIEIISSYAFEENMKPFWTVFGAFLEKASDIAEGHQRLSSHPSKSTKWHSSFGTLFQYWNRKLCGLESGRIDHANFRFLLWKCISHLNANMAEPRSRILVPLVLRFVKREYSLQEDHLMEAQDLRKEISEDRQQAVEGSEVITAAAPKPVLEKKTDSGGHRKSLYKTLVAMLTAFSKFKNPKTFYKQEELKQLLMKLLTHKLPDVQRLVLSCLLTYKPPYLLPYKENLERLLEDQTFREELMSFSADSSCSVVSAEHREQLLPVLVRLLYGRMQRLGSHESSKTGGSSRQGTVLRFLGSCEERDMEEFIKLITLPFQELRSDGTDRNAVSVENPGHVIPLRKQQGFLNLLGQMISTVGSNIKHYLSVLFPILLNLGASCTSLLDQRHLIQPHFVTQLKASRQLILGRVSECYDCFLDHDFGEHTESVFASLVWPQLPKLPNECVQSPTALLKLLSTWTAHQKYFQLLRMPVPTNTCQFMSDSILPSNNVTPSGPLHILDYVYSCLGSTGVSPSVCDYIVQMTLNLLSAESGLSTSDKLQNEKEKGESLGVDLVLPHLPKLLEYLEKSIQKSLKQDKQGEGLQMKFTLLSEISGFVENPDHSTLLIQLLLPFLTKTSFKYKKYEEEILFAAKKLVGHCAGMSIRPFSELFSSLTGRRSRASLCDIFMEIANKDPHWQNTANVVAKLNAWDSKRIDEPDYDSRLEGFKEATEKLLSFESSHDFLEEMLPVVHNALFFLTETEDMSLRDGAASYVSTLIKHLTPQDGEAFNAIVLGAILNTVKQGLRSKAEFARHEAISVLSQLVKTFPTHWRFSDLAPLSHHDAEADFFENVKHIQLHRRTRAFRKLAAVCGEGGVSQTSCLWFLLPLANQVVFRPPNNTEQNLLGEAISVIGTISSHLNWTNYCFMLTHYLRQLAKQIEIQKSLVKVVVAVLDSFHFDLSMITSEDVQATRSYQSDAEAVISSGSSPAVQQSGVIAQDSSDVTEDMVTEMECDLKDESSRTDNEKAAEKSTTSVQKILKSIVHSILPSLQNILTKRIDVAGHKLSSLGQNEDSEILRVPVAMAMTKLLLALPKETLHTHLPSLLLKVCQTLKNRSRDVRDVGRSTLVKMAVALGPQYLQYMIKEMKDTLDRGYMLHVLGYSLHTLLRGMTPHLEPGDLDSCLELTSSILMEDLFGVPAEERESGEKVAKIPESKTPQSYNCYEIMGTFLSPKLLPDLLEPVKQRLESQCTAHCVHIVEEVFRRVGIGIHANQAFTPQALLVFIHGLLSDSVSQLSSKPKPKAVATNPLSATRLSDSRLLPPTPQRANTKSVAISNTGASVVSEFGLQLFHVALKRGKFDTSSEQLLAMMDPFVSLLTNSLSSRHIKVISRALQVLVWLVRLPLPSLPSHIDELLSQLFELLRQYARAGAAVGATNRELVLSAFKAMTVIVRDYKKHTVSEDELKLLLSFVEEDIHDYQRQSTAFPLLKAILVRKLVVSEIYDVMLKACQLSVTSDSDHVRLQCRQTILMFLMDYPLGKKLNRYLDFFVSNLSYEGQSGRESVLEMFSSMFTKFPEKMIQRHSSYFLVPLASQLINDESPTCRQMVAETVKLLLRRLDSSRINDVIAILNAWIESDNLLHKRLGIQMLSLLIEVEGQGFEKRVSTYLPVLTDLLSLYDPNSTKEDLTKKASTKPNHTDKDSDIEPALETAMSEDGAALEEASIGGHDEGMDVEENGGELEHEEEATRPEMTGEAAMAALDHLLFTTLSSIHKLIVQCSILRASSFASHMTDMWGSVQLLLLHPHAWVRLASCQLYGLLFSTYTPDELVTLATSGPDKKRARRSKGREEVKSTEYLLEETLFKVQELSHVFCTQLWSPLLKDDLANQAVKNLVFCAKVLHRFQLAGKISDTDSDYHSNTRDLPWLIAQLARLARFEAGHHPKKCQKRTCVLRWTAAVSVDLGEEQLPSYLPSLLAPVYRELSDSSKRAGEELFTLAQEVVDFMKGVCGREAFSRAYAQVHQSVTGVREKRRRQAALEAVANPEKSIRRKRKKNELKKAAKKIKILHIRPDSTAAASVRRKSKHKH